MQENKKEHDVMSEIMATTNGFISEKEARPNEKLSRHTPLDKQQAKRKRKARKQAKLRKRQARQLRRMRGY